jgi:flagellar P-ring protein precursor FlgI
MAPLKGADNQVYVVAQGSVLPLSNTMDSSKIAGTIPLGALIERVSPHKDTNYMDIDIIPGSQEEKPGLRAKVVLNERTGTIVMGEMVRISAVEVSHGNLSLVIKKMPEEANRASYKNVGNTRQAILPEGANVGDVLRVFSKLQVAPSDCIGIFQAIKASGALQGDLSLI